ncbi:MAG: family serine peptidase [Flavipsychrobacter sp.]|jgi:hypothetical protein|nr:family serine peptidase [Flavipsychrobacter sp.]
MVRTLYCLIVISCLFIAANTLGQGTHTVYLHTGAVTIPSNAAAWIDSTAAQREPVQAIVHFSALPTEEQKKAMQQNGITLIDYIPDNAYTAIVYPPLDKEILLSFPVYGFANARPEWKVSSYVWNEVAMGNNEVEILVSFARDLSKDAIQQFVTTMGGKIKNGKLDKYGAYNVAITAARIRSLAQWYGVRYISPVTEIEPLDLKARPVVKGNVAAASPVFGGYGLTGDSVTVGVGDDCSGIYHADLKDRIRNYNPAAMGKHGAHVNGIVGGAGNIDPFGVGMATKVSLIDFLYDLVLPSTGTMYMNYNMTLTNNSYTIVAHNCTYHGSYDVYSNFLDSLALQYPYVLHVFASGNDGYATCPPYPQGFATIGGGFQPAKNIIVVGSVLDGMLQSPDESRGPMKDGRIKPEITAVGVIPWSTILEDDYGYAAGTSMASPQVVGGLAMLTQRYKNLHSGAQPYGDILKTIALNGAMDYGNPGPDYTYGFGIMDMYRSLQILDNNHYYTNNINHGDSQATVITVPPNTAQLKVMLCWNDMPASPASSKQIVNDLDLSVADVSGNIRRPLVLDHTPANVNSIATEKADHLNNTEQVTITNPVPGTYTIKTKAYNVPRGPQRFVVAYDIIPRGLQLTHPIGGEQVSNGTTPFDSIRVFFDAVGEGNTFKVEFSENDGSSWTTISENVPAHIRYAGFYGTGVNSGKCRVRVSRNGTSETQTSGRFTINQQPVVVLDTAQCPGYVNIHWSPIPNATSYYLLKKVGKYMQVIDSTADTAYTFSNMPLTAKSYVAVQPVIDGGPGYRSKAAIVIANTGSCTKPVSNGDLMVEALASPNAGRQFTNSAFTAGSVVKVRVRDMYAAACNNYIFSYKVNAGIWQTLVSPMPIPANGIADVSIAGLPLTTLGAYNITVAIQNLDVTDPQQGNDSLSFTIRSLPNDTVNLSAPFTDGFETMPIFEVTGDSMGLSPNGRWDFFSNDEFGRLRSFIDIEMGITGTRSVHMDEIHDVPAGSKNTFTGTFNLDNYDTAAAEIRMDFDYMLHGIPKSPDGNVVSVRAYDTLPWNPIHFYDLAAYPGTLTTVKSLSLTDAVRLSGSNFSTACQVSFGQNDTSLIATEAYGNGITIDNFRMYTVVNDIALVSILSPVQANCGLASPQPLTVKVHNGVNYTLHNVQLFYNVDGGPTVMETIDSIRGKADMVYQFIQKVSMAGGATHNLNVWVKVAGDSYIGNDSINNYFFRNSPIVSSFPYLQDFEQNDGGFYSVGFKNSWQYGTPAAARIKKAASGAKAWKTSLTGSYNNLELSYLYSPCFDISGLTNPMLSFSSAMDIENCGNILCDAAYVEVSFDGNTWTKLGSVGQGTNWYDSTFNLWNTEGFTRWHVTSIPLTNPGSGVIVRFRFVLSTDPGVINEGVAIDDIHIFDRARTILPATDVTTATNGLSGTAWNDFSLANQVLASVQPGGQNISNTAVTLYEQDTLSNRSSTQYTMPRSYTIKAGQEPDSMGVRLYLTDEEFVKVVNDTLCPSCTDPADAYSLGITQYMNKNNAMAENGTLKDDTGGVFTYHPYKKVKWVPYDNGYYAEIKAKPFSEYWFNDGGPTGEFHVAEDYLSFFAYRKGTYAVNTWYSKIDSFVNIYTPEWSIDSINFATILDTPALHRKEAAYSIDDYVNFTKYEVFWFRLRWTMTGKEGFYYSPIRRVGRGDSASTMITFDAKMVSRSDVLLTWNSKVDVAVKHYVLDRAKNSGEFVNVGNVNSLRGIDQGYSYVDNPPSGLPTGTMLHYRLTAVFEDGTILVLPIRTVEWVDKNAVTNAYPNPTRNGALTIDWQADAGSVLKLSLADVTGRRIFETTATATQWNNTTTIQTLSFPRGMYFMTMFIDDRKYVMKVVYE